MTQIGYLAHDLTDPAIHRRVAMLQAGGATVAVAGLARGAVTLPGAMVLGQSADAKLGARAVGIGAIVARQRARVRAHLGAPHVLIARNLEMLAVAVSVIGGFAVRPRLVYECLDIHRLLIAKSPAGMAMRALERRLAPHVDLVITSSPAFIMHHLGAVFGDRILLVENRVPDFQESGAYLHHLPLTPGPPWHIGWFGALRCRKSLALLSEAARLADGGIMVTIRGRPSPAIFPDLAGEVACHPYLRFDGPYEQSQLGQLYAKVHFAWSIDMYEAGANSEWLLPNRLYESVHNGSVPIARRDNEAGRFLDRLNIGVTLHETSAPALVSRLSHLGPDAYRELLRRQRGLPRRYWRVDRADCVALVRALAGQDHPVRQRRVP